LGKHTFNSVHKAFRLVVKHGYFTATLRFWVKSPNTHARNFILKQDLSFFNLIHQIKMTVLVPHYGNNVINVRSNFYLYYILSFF